MEFDQRRCQQKFDDTNFKGWQEKKKQFEGWQEKKKLEQSHLPTERLEQLLTVHRIHFFKANAL